MSSTTDSKPTILLVPGAWHPASCLDSLRAELHKASYPTVSEQLACLAPSDPDAHSVSTDAAYIRDSLLLPLLDDGKRVVMVLHSYAGHPGSGAAYGLSVEEREEAGLKGGVVGLIFMAAFVVSSGQSNVAQNPPPLDAFSVDEKVRSASRHVAYGIIRQPRFSPKLASRYPCLQYPSLPSPRHKLKPSSHSFRD